MPYHVLDPPTPSQNACIPKPPRYVRQTTFNSPATQVASPTWKVPHLHLSPVTPPRGNPGSLLADPSVQWRTNQRRRISQRRAELAAATTTPAPPCPSSPPAAHGASPPSPPARCASRRRPRRRQHQRSTPPTRRRATPRPRSRPTLPALGAATRTPRRPRLTTRASSRSTLPFSPIRRAPWASLTSSRSRLSTSVLSLVTVVSARAPGGGGRGGSEGGVKWAVDVDEKRKRRQRSRKTIRGETEQQVAKIVHAGALRRSRWLRDAEACASGHMCDAAVVGTDTLSRRRRWPRRRCGSRSERSPTELARKRSPSSTTTRLCVPHPTPTPTPFAQADNAGGGPLGHPKIFINLDKEGPRACGYW